LDVLEEFVMLELKTHFEQVPLAIIKEMIKRQNDAEAATGPGRGTKKKPSQGPASKAESRQRRKSR
jgi:hypothetical protein